MYREEIFTLDEEDFSRVLKYAENNPIKYTLKGDKEYRYYTIDINNMFNIPQTFKVCPRFPIGSPIGNSVTIPLGNPKPLEIECNVIMQNASAQLSELHEYSGVKVYLHPSEVRNYFNKLDGFT